MLSIVCRDMRNDAVFQAIKTLALDERARSNDNWINPARAALSVACHPTQLLAADVPSLFYVNEKSGLAKVILSILPKVRAYSCSLFSFCCISGSGIRCCSPESLSKKQKLGQSGSGEHVGLSA